MYSLVKRIGGNKDDDDNIQRIIEQNQTEEEHN